jgi:hypothetical protein
MVVSGRLGLAEFLTRIGEFARKNHDFINDLMRKELDAKRYRNLQVAILVGMKSPSNVYTQVLCDILNLRSVEVNNSDVIDLLDDIRDPRSVPCLLKGAKENWDLDEYKHLNKKCIWILGAINTPEAKNALQELSQDSSSEIRLWAEEELNK